MGNTTYTPLPQSVIDYDEKHEDCDITYELENVIQPFTVWNVLVDLENKICGKIKINYETPVEYGFPHQFFRNIKTDFKKKLYELAIKKKSSILDTLHIRTTKDCLVGGSYMLFSTYEYTFDEEVFKLVNGKNEYPAKTQLQKFKHLNGLFIKNNYVVLMTIYDYCDSKCTEYVKTVSKKDIKFVLDNNYLRVNKNGFIELIDRNNLKDYEFHSALSYAIEHNSVNIMLDMRVLPFHFICNNLPKHFKLEDFIEISHLFYDKINTEQLSQNLDITKHFIKKLGTDILKDISIIPKEVLARQEIINEINGLIVNTMTADVEKIIISQEFFSHFELKWLTDESLNKISFSSLIFPNGLDNIELLDDKSFIDEHFANKEFPKKFFNELMSRGDAVKINFIKNLIKKFPNMRLSRKYLNNLEIFDHMIKFYIDSLLTYDLTSEQIDRIIDQTNDSDTLYKVWCKCKNIYKFIPIMSCELAEKILMTEPMLITIIPIKYQTQKAASYVVRQNKDLIQYIVLDEEFYCNEIRHDPDVFRYVKNKTLRICLTALLYKPQLINEMDNPPKELIVIAEML
uniref:DUF4116 domain-containing protein n=1 Tax=viral metagenome TaxID=1070528 RepID=A0A6C0E9K3_9ZZZZ